MHSEILNIERFTKYSQKPKQSTPRSQVRRNRNTDTSQKHRTIASKSQGNKKTKHTGTLKFQIPPSFDPQTPPCIRPKRPMKS